MLKPTQPNSWIRPYPLVSIGLSQWCLILALILPLILPLESNADTVVKQSIDHVSLPPTLTLSTSLKPIRSAQSNASTLKLPTIPQHWQLDPNFTTVNILLDGYSCTLKDLFTKVVTDVHFDRHDPSNSHVKVVATNDDISATAMACNGLSQYLYDANFKLPQVVRYDSTQVFFDSEQHGSVMGNLILDDTSYPLNFTIDLDTVAMSLITDEPIIPFKASSLALYSNTLLNKTPNLTDNLTIKVDGQLSYVKLY